MHPFYSFLINRLKNQLPGREAQLRMCPVPLDPEVVLPGEQSETAHPSSVLIPIYSDENSNLHTILTLRTNSVSHAGQISFPGGRLEKDENLRDTALRETEEEVGISRSEIQIAGSITPLYLYRSDNQITPFVGFMQEKPELKTNPFEVEEAFNTPLDSLLSEKTLIRETWTLRDTKYDVPYWNVHRVPLWGATAMIMSELLVLYREFLTIHN